VVLKLWRMSCRERLLAITALHQVTLMQKLADQTHEVVSGRNDVKKCHKRGKRKLVLL